MCLFNLIYFCPTQQHESNLRPSLVPNMPNYTFQEYSENDYGKDVINMLFNQVKGVFGGIENYISKGYLNICH